MKKKIICISCCLILCIGLACNVLAYAQDDIVRKDSFYAIGSDFDGIYSYNAPGVPGGVFLTNSAFADAYSYYDLQFPWLDAISLELNGTFINRSWSIAGHPIFIGPGESDLTTTNFKYENALYIQYYMSMVSSPDYHIRLFFQDIPSYLLTGFEVQTLSQSGSGNPDWTTGYVDSVPYDLYKVSEVPDRVWAFPMTARDGVQIYMNDMFTQATYADNVYLLEFDAYNLDVVGFRLVFKNVSNLSYSDYASMSGSWFQQIGQIFNGFPVVLADMFKYFFTALPFVGTLTVVAGMFLFIATVHKWAGG